MTISVILPTLRVGGLDIVCASLARQTHTDFELIIADGIHQYRARHIAGRLAALPFPVRHLASGGVELSNYSRAINDAVAVARGDIIYMAPDYSWFPPDCLEIHARYHAEHRGEKRILASGYSYTDLPTRHPCFPGYSPEIVDCNAKLDLSPDGGTRYEECLTIEAERYERDLQSGLLDPVMWSLGTEPVTPESIEALPIRYTHKLFDCEFSFRYCSLKSESYPVEAFLELNGLDEDLDGSHLFQDLAWAYRLDAAGWEYDRTRGGELRIPNPRGVFASKRVLRPMRMNQYESERKRVHGLPVNPEWSLRDRRAAHHAV